MSVSPSPLKSAAICVSRGKSNSKRLEEGSTPMNRNPPFKYYQPPYMYNGDMHLVMGRKNVRSRHENPSHTSGSTGGFRRHSGCK
eukprot:1158899-Pelagomonas_calceolata.AAC.9